MIYQFPMVFSLASGIDVKKRGNMMYNDDIRCLGAMMFSYNYIYIHMHESMKGISPEALITVVSGCSG